MKFLAATLSKAGIVFEPGEPLNQAADWVRERGYVLLKPHHSAEAMVPAA